MVLAALNIECRVREVKLSAKPDSLLQLSPKATVPVLVLPCGAVLDESLEVIRWALAQHSDQFGWLETDLTHDLVGQNDGEFKRDLDHYKYPQRYEGIDAEQARLGCITFLNRVQTALLDNDWSLKKGAPDDWHLAEVLIFPFIRQCYFVAPERLEGVGLDALLAWLASALESSLFTQVMVKHPFWFGEGDAETRLLGCV